MKYTFAKIYQFAVMLLMVAVVTSCRDDYFDSFFGDGGDRISLTVDFKPMSEQNLETRSVPGEKGDCMSDINDFVIVAFDEEGYFAGLFDLSSETDKINFKDDDIDRTDVDAENGKTSEVTTKRRTYPKLEVLPTGKFYLYGVANLRNLMSDANGGAIHASSTKDILQAAGFDNGVIPKKTKEDFKAMRMQWSLGDIEDNAAMAGVITLEGAAAKDGNEKVGDAPIYVRPGIQLHCWLRRLASKVTVLFDASKLSPSTTIYLKSIKVKDIAANCPIIDDNMAYHPEYGETTKPYWTEKGLVGTVEGNKENTTDGRCIQLCLPEYSAIGDEETQHEFWPRLTAGLPTLEKFYQAEMVSDFPGTKEELKEIKERIKKISHSNTAPSIFFFENKQGSHKDKPKAADANGDGIIDSPDSYNPEVDVVNFKDGVYGGTYVEVEAYYHSLEPYNEGEGRIFYRFMLGNDVVDNYDVDRNSHYKLTLAFNGHANDVDWHIEYDTDRPPFSMPDEYYISYGYNEMMEFPITISGELVGTDGKPETAEIIAKIIRNDWQPSKMWEDIFADTKAINNNTTSSTYSSFYNENDVVYPENNKLVYGFLSLRKSHDNVIGDVNLKRGDAAIPLLNVWNGVQIDENNYPRNGRALWTRTYDFKDLPTSDTGKFQKTYGDNEDANDMDNDNNDGSYRVYSVKNTVSSTRQTTFYIPMFTRERNLVKDTGYTGENPYAAYQRRGKVKFKFRVKDKNNYIHDCEKDVNIIQVAKVGNPMGIWRAWNNASSFDVKLQIPNTNDMGFTALTSHEGGWSAEVEQGADWILLNGGKKKIYGEKDTEIAFTYKPASILSSPNQVRCGIITVRYHNFSCIHKIFVRQGYAPLQIMAGGPKWHTGNLVTKKEEASNPCDEGSLFRAGNLDYPIAASNNVNDKEEWIHVTPADFKDHTDTPLTIAGMTGTTKLWSEIKAPLTKDNYDWAYNSISKSSMMTGEHIMKLIKNDEIRYQYGVMYGDNATVTLSDQNQAYKYMQHDAKTHGYGMRGCFVYNKNDGRQIFFPIGASGYGKRKNTGTLSNYGTDAKPLPGTLGWVNGVAEVGTAIVRYSCGRITYMTSGSSAKFTPLFFDIFRANGGGYWFGKDLKGDNSLNPDGKVKFSLDLNYNTFDFNVFGTESFQDRSGQDVSDAMYIRLVTE